MTADYKALCAELLQQLDWLLGGPVPEESNPGRVADRARAALAVEAVGPTDEDLTALVRVFHVAYNAKRTELCALPNRYQHDTESAMADRAGLRAVLARYATHPRPIPVAERPLLKRDSFSDKIGRCWCGTAACVDQTGDFDVHMPASWELREPCPEDDCLLPAAAIPLPNTIL
jgi:hypothetical protein